MAGKYDKMSFGKAFAAARKAHGGDGGKFSWKGKSYTTNAKKKTAAPTKSLRPKTRPGLPKDEKIKVTELAPIGSTSKDTIKNKTNKALIKSAKKPKMFASSSASAKPIKKAPSKNGILGLNYKDWLNMSKDQRKKKGLPMTMPGGILQFKTKQQIEKDKIRKSNIKPKKTPKITNKSKTESRADKARKLMEANKKKQAQRRKDLKQAER